MDDANKAAAERRTADLLVRGLPASQQNLWRCFKHAGRFHFLGSDVLSVRKRCDEGIVTTVAEEFRPTKIEASFDHGVELTVESLQTGHTYVITHYPRLLGRHNVFVWIPPYFSDIRYLQGVEGFRLSMNIAFRSAHAPSFEMPHNQYLTKE